MRNPHEFFRMEVVQPAEAGIVPVKGILSPGGSVPFMGRSRRPSRVLRGRGPPGRGFSPTALCADKHRYLAGDPMLVGYGVVGGDRRVSARMIKRVWPRSGGGATRDRGLGIEKGVGMLGGLGVPRAPALAPSLDLRTV